MTGGAPRESTFNLRLTEGERNQLDALTIALSNELGRPVTRAEAIRLLIARERTRAVKPTVRKAKR
jgi:hypothetical protein